MNEQRRIAMALALMMALSLPAMAEEEPAKPEAVKSEAAWVLSEAGARVGVERMKRVLSVKRKRYSSIEITYDEGQKRPRLTSHHARDEDGTLRKYQTKEVVRLGKGIRAFRRGVGIRIAGVNQKFEPVEIPKASEHHIWDKDMLSGLALWLAMASRSGEVSFKVIDVAQRSSVTARLVPEAPSTLGNAEGRPVTLNCWRAWAAGAEVASLCADASSELISVKAGRRSLLAEGWTWEVPTPAEEPDPDAGSEESSASQSDAGGEGTGVGP